MWTAHLLRLPAPEYRAGVVVEQPPAEGDFDLMVGDLVELATVMDSKALQHI
jgi:hypothetical protein